MSSNEELVELLSVELKQIRKNMAGMLDNSVQSRVTLERIDKTLVDQKSDIVEDDTISYEQDTSITDDMKKVIEAQKKLVDRAKSEDLEASTKAEADDAEKKASESTRLDEEQLAAQRKNNESQMQTNDYLRILTDLTHKNDVRIADEIARGKSTSQIGPDGKPIKGNGNNAGLLERSFIRTGEGGSELGGGFGQILSGFREMGLKIKSSKEYVTGFGSRRRQKKITNVTKEINRNKAILSAEKEKVEQLRSSGYSERKLKPNLDRMTARKDMIRASSNTFGDLTSTEYLYQKGRSDKNFRKGKMSTEDRDLLLNQSKRKIADSVMRDVDGTRQSRSNGVVAGLGGIFGTKPSATLSRTKEKKQNTRVFDTPISATINPKTYGEYIAGIYNELENLNDSFEGIQPQQQQGIGGASGGGGGLIGGVLGSIGGMIAGSLFKPLAKMFLKGGKIGNLMRKTTAGSIKGVSKTKSSRAALKKARAAKGMLKSGVKTGVKIGVKKAGTKAAVKVAGKTLSKSLLKKIPLGIGTLVALGLAANEISKGNYGRATAEVASGIASFVPIVGTAASFGIDAGLAADEMGVFDHDMTPAKAMKHKVQTKSRTAVDPRTGKVIRTREDAQRAADAERTAARQTMSTRTTMSGVQSATNRESVAAMEIQAKLIGNEIAKIYSTPEYINNQTKIAKQQGKAVADATFA